MHLINIFSFIVVSLLLAGNVYSIEDVVFQNRLLTIPSTDIVTCDGLLF